MRATLDEAPWAALAAEVFIGMKEWRLHHPKATFAEIEAALDTRWAAVRARLLQDLALASAATDVQALRPEDRPRCPACGGPLVVQGPKTRTVTVTHEQTVTLTRDYARCTTCGAGLSPPG